MKTFKLKTILLCLGLILVGFVTISQAQASASKMKVSVNSEYNTGNKITISWTKVDNTTKYGFTIWKAPYGSSTVFNDYVTGTSRNIGTLPAGTYKVVMRPYTSSIFTLFRTVTNGPASDPVYFTVKAPKPVKIAPAFIERTSAPSAKDIHYYSSQNTFVPPNCTWYAFGRAWEIRGTPIPHYAGNAKDWWKYTTLTKNKTIPALGAIAVWGDVNNANSAGHVAVVERIDGGTVTVSEGNYSGSYFHRETVAQITSRNDCGPFLGYIYIR